ncbi:unnamed protein product [Caenorhabditis nigoni]
MIEFQMCKYNHVPKVCDYDRDKESVTESIHNYFLDFFGSSTNCIWRVNKIEEDFITFVPKLKNVSFCVDLRLDEEFTEMAILETFFFSFPILKSVRLEAALTTELFNPESKFYQAESICVNQFQHTFPNVLRHFQGRQAIVNCTQWGASEDVIGFVNRWKSGEAFQKLEYLYFALWDGEILENQILNEIETKYIDSTKQPPTHTLPKIYDWHRVHAEPNTDPIISHTYVVRATDNHVASILIQERTISFGVWNKTEEEFLKLMN